jgi:hypothetical protein
MAIVIEDGTGLSTAEAYISVDDADEYFAARGVTTWTGTDAAKEEALRKGATYLDNAYRGKWRGYRSNEDQALAWPRASWPANQAFFETSTRANTIQDEDGYNIANNAVPRQIKHANCEAALLYLSGEDPMEALSRGGAIKRTRVKAGPVEKETEYSESASSVDRYPVIEGLLRSLVTGQPGASFGSVTIMRG